MPQSDSFLHSCTAPQWPRCACMPLLWGKMSPPAFWRLELHMRDGVMTFSLLISSSTLLNVVISLSHLKENDEMDPQMQSDRSGFVPTKRLNSFNLPSFRFVFAGLWCCWATGAASCWCLQPWWPERLWQEERLVSLLSGTIRGTVQQCCFGVL